jgi:EPS-associated MarR family transcriptional regulator
MSLLEKNPGITQRELAQKLGISLGGVNYCIKALIQKGLIKMRNFTNSKNKFGYVYRLTPTGIVERSVAAHEFLRRKIEEHDALKAEIDALKRDLKDK